MSPDAAVFADTMCQLCDMVHPRKEAVFTRRDLIRSRMAPLFFDMLFNLNKFVLAESRDVARIRHIHDTPEQSDWDRWAAQCYYVLAGAEQAEEDVAQQTQAALDLSQGLQVLQSMDLDLDGTGGDPHGGGGLGMGLGLSGLGDLSLDSIGLLDHHNGHGDLNHGLHGHGHDGGGGNGGGGDGHHGGDGLGGLGLGHGHGHGHGMHNGLHGDGGGGGGHPLSHGHNGHGHGQHLSGLGQTAAAPVNGGGGGYGGLDLALYGGDGGGLGGEGDMGTSLNANMQ